MTLKEKISIYDKVEDAVRDISVEYALWKEQKSWRLCFLEQHNFSDEELFHYFKQEQYPERPQRAFIGTSVDPEDLRL